MSINEYTHIGGDIMDLVEIFKAFGDETRIRILNLLGGGELCVCEIETILGITQSNASRHLNKLRAAGIITYEKKSQWVYYRMNEEFLERCDLLYRFFNREVQKNPVYQDDMAKLSKFKESNLSCKEIEEDREKVLQCLKCRNK